MKKIFTLIVVLLAALGLYAQPRMSGQPQMSPERAYRFLYSFGNTPITAKNVIRGLVMNPMLKFTPEEAERYGHEQLLSDLADLFNPIYQAHVTPDDVHFMLAIYRSPMVRQSMRVILDVVDAPAEEQGKYTTPGISALTAGKQAEPVKLEEGITPEFLAACTQYLEKSGRLEYLRQIKAPFGQIPDNRNAQMLVNIFDYILANTPVIQANLAKGKVSEQDFNLFSGLYETPAFQHFRAGNLAVSAQRQQILMEINQRALQWKQLKQQQEEHE